MTSYRYSASLLLVVVLMFLSGCAGLTTSKYPLPPDREQLVKEQFGGEWMAGTDTICIQFDKDMVGTVISLDVGGNSKGPMMEIIVTSSDKDGFISALLIEDGKKQDEYYLVRYRLVEPDILVFWHLKGEPFEDAIGKNLLQADAANRHMITTPPEQLLEFIKSNDSKELFDYRNPVVARKIGNRCALN